MLKFQDWSKQLDALIEGEYGPISVKLDDDFRTESIGVSMTLKFDESAELTISKELDPDEAAKLGNHLIRWANLVEADVDCDDEETAD